MMSTFLALFFVLAPAAEHERAALALDDAGQLGPAVDEYVAAYRSLPDVRRDRAARLRVLGSLRSTLLALHARDGEAAPLCRLQVLLGEHVDALRLAYPQDPGLSEIHNVRARQAEVTRQLVALGPDACRPPAPAKPPPPGPREPPRPAPIARPVEDAIPPRHLKIAGGVTLGLGVPLLGGVVVGVVSQQQARARARELDERRTGPSFTRAESEQLSAQLAKAQFGRQLAIATGVAAGVTTVVGTTLLVLGRRSARARRWSVAPWWSPAGAGLTVGLQLEHPQ